MESSEQEPRASQYAYIPLGNGIYRVAGFKRSAITGRYLTSSHNQEPAVNELPRGIAAGRIKKQDLPKGQVAVSAAPGSRRNAARRRDAGTPPLLTSAAPC